MLLVASADTGMTNRQFLIRQPSRDFPGIVQMADIGDNWWERCLCWLRSWSRFHSCPI